ncbi:hypothetical protein B0H14DRAFT_841959 [Mycena olivaceomarginata]|nr:hypothetical protein B0H14DRAFT_841959 [Mycena olivaceomarginata]
MEGPAAQLGYAYYTLCRVGHPSRPQRIMEWVPFTEYQEVQNVINLLTPSQLSLDNLVNIQWILCMLPLHIYDQTFNSRDLEEFLADLDHSMPTLDCSGFTDYLFCVYAFLSPGDVNQNDIVCMNKSQFQKQIFEHLLTTVISKLESNQISMNTVAHITRTTHLLASRSKDNRGWNLNENERRSIIYQFCSSLPKVDGWVVVVLATGQLTQWHWSLTPRSLEGLAGASWVYEALESAVPGSLLL